MRKYKWSRVVIRLGNSEVEMCPEDCLPINKPINNNTMNQKFKVGDKVRLVSKRTDEEGMSPVGMIEVGDEGEVLEAWEIVDQEEEQEDDE